MISIERLLLARACGFRGSEAVADFLKEARSRREEVRMIANRHYLAIDPIQEAVYSLLGSDDSQAIQPELQKQLLGNVAFADPKQAIARLRQLAHEPFFILSQARTERRLAMLLPRLLPLLEITPNPDETLHDFLAHCRRCRRPLSILRYVT